jgi:N-acetylmuramic acid 6-phosphate etherase
VRYEELATEQRNPRSRDLDLLSMPELLRVIHEEDRRVPDAIEKALPVIAVVADRAARALGGSGRLIYVGAGTSGRLGVLDAAECPPTFGTDPSRVVALIAGGWEAVFRAKEGAEDDRDAGAAELSAMDPGREDLIVGIAASGITPYVHGALAAARTSGAATALITAGNPENPPADHVIRLETGPEVLAGSTRMKAGTATKIVLNMISTGAMVKIGKVHDNLMVDLRVGSAKLRQRAIRLVASLTGLTSEQSADALDHAGGEVKTAVVAHGLGISPAESRHRIDRAGGHLRVALGEVSK